MAGGESERCRAAAGVADQMKLLPPAPVGLAEYPGDLGIEAVVTRRFCGRIDLQVFGHGVRIRPERREERAVGVLGGKHAPRQEHCATRHRAPVSVTSMPGIQLAR